VLQRGILTFDTLFFFHFCGTQNGTEAFIFGWLADGYQVMGIRQKKHSNLIHS
jgi:hypothetical protein